VATRIKFVSPQGRAKYPWLTKPDTQFDSNGVYSCQLILDEPDDLVKQIQAVAKEEFAAKDKCRLPFAKDEETGELVIKTKSKYQPKFYDATGQVLTGNQIPNLWGGSVLKIGGFITPYQVSGSKGITLQLSKVQIINPVSSSDGEDGGFDVVEGGFIADELTEEPFDATETVDQGSTEKADRF
jgi:hypothetical protein